VAECISRLQRGKAPGLDGIMAEHVLYAHPVISTVLARLQPCLTMVMFLRLLDWVLSFLF